MTKTIEMPYGDGAVTIDVPEDKLMGVFEPKGLPPAEDPMQCLRQAMAAPVGTAPLRELAKGKKSVALVIEDACRPTPDTLLVDAVMEELTAAGVTPEQVKVIVGVGLHRPNTDEENAASLGKWAGRIHIENHNAKDKNRLTFIGETSRGTPVSINSTFMEAELKILCGDVEFHQFVGYGGGAKGVSPGIADSDTIHANHCGMDLPGTGAGRIDGNPVRMEINEIGEMAGVDFNLSVALDDKHRIVAAVAGELDKSFREACKYVDQMYVVDIPGRPDLVIASPGGYPKDMELYQSQKAIEEATLIVKPGGSVLITAECREGSGSKLFEEWMEGAYRPEELCQRIKENFTMGGHKSYQIAREVMRANVYLYSSIPPGRVRSWMMIPVAERHFAELVERADSVLALPQSTLTQTRLPQGG